MNAMHKGLVYVVENDAAISLIVTEQLKDAGYNVREFYAARDAFNAPRSDIPSAVITDNNLESVNAGMKVLAATKQENIPAIMISATATPAQVLAAGGSQAKLIMKPFKFNALLSALDTALAKGPQR